MSGTTISVETALPAAEVEPLYALYAAALAPLADRAASGRPLTADEFAAELADPRIEKYVARDAAGRPAGLATLATDPAAVSWVSTEYLAARYPGHAARGAIFYLGPTVVRPDLRGSRLPLELADRAVQRSRRAGAVVGVDVCAYLADRDATRGLALVGRRHGYGLGEVDRQTYYVMDPALLGRPPGTVVAPDAGELRVVRLADRPELLAGVAAVLAARWPHFLLYGTPAHGLDLLDLLARVPRHVAVLVDGAGAAHGAGLSVPLRWDGTAADLPAGWDGTLLRAHELLATGGQPNAVAALAVTADPGAGDAADALLPALREAAAEIGAGTLIAPVRPAGKARYPLHDPADYAEWRDADGRAFDPELRRHRALGARVLGPAAPSLTVTGSVAQWRDWTGLAFPASGEYVIPDGLVPLAIDRQRDVGTYREPGVWVAHSLKE
ncbi:hypothetical protein GCM10010123_40530 [Pilimelia anulata]|uniref:Uncharacterized protein n=1 Tax=Pilimelia anulata TaxID=53371 RepID=A0A8J3BB99_9ACTN|nr:hypothetical protein [Pilimelia anulata]GGK06655.1 hypothetical protein GCM10010123_40530 [Pilimelia anulata]